jgi:predicted nucleic acid-binding protein
VLLVDTSVWIGHLRRGDDRLVAALDAGAVLSHPFVIGELACGAIRRRETFLADLRQLPSAAEAAHHEVLGLLERHRLHGRGLGWTDVHLLASALLSGVELYTHDASLAEAWRRVR